MSCVVKIWLHSPISCVAFADSGRGQPAAVRGIDPHPSYTKPLKAEKMVAPVSPVFPYLSHLLSIPDKPLGSTAGTAIGKPQIWEPAGQTVGS